MIAALKTWAPALLLGAGALMTVGVDAQRSMPLRQDLDKALPQVIEGARGTDIVISKEEQQVAGMSSYVMRVFSPDASERDLTAAAFSVYVGYYRQQMQGKTIHSPKNCLPGAGWEALTTSVATIPTASGPVEVTQYLLQRGDSKALVLYWYQGRGRVEANEYAVKWDLLRDAALKHRSDEALVRVVVPVTADDATTTALATKVASAVVPAVYSALPL